MLDEPTASLDGKTKLLVRDMLKKLKEVLNISEGTIT
jgi:ABC-type multidrug transport system ATPase subunit